MINIFLTTAIFVTLFTYNNRSQADIKPSSNKKYYWKEIRKKHRLQKEKTKQKKTLTKSQLSKVDKKILPLTNAIYLCHKYSSTMKGAELDNCVSRLRSGKKPNTKHPLPSP